MTDSPDSPLPFMNDAQRATARKIVLFTVFLDVLGIFILAPQLAVYAAQFGASPQFTGFLSSVYSMMGFLFTPFWGRLSDLKGRRPILLTSIFGTGAGYVLFALAGSLPLLFAARIIDGITGANISTAQAYLSDITPAEERSKIFAFFGVIFGVGVAIGPLIGSALTHLPGAWGGNLGLGMFSATLSFINWALALRFLPETLSPQIRAQNVKSGEGKRLALFNFSGFGRALKIPNLNRAIVIAFFTAAAFATIQGNYSLFILKNYTRPIVQAEIKANPQEAAKRALVLSRSETSSSPSALLTGKELSGQSAASGLEGDAAKPYPPSMGGDFNFHGAPAPEGLSWRHVEKLLVRPQSARLIGNVFGVIGILSLIIGGSMRFFSKRWSELSLVLTGTLVMSLGLILIAGFERMVPAMMWGQYLASSVLTIGSGLATPVLTSLVTQFSPEEQRGEVLGIYQSTQSLGRIVGPNLGGWLFQWVSSGAPFVAGGMIMLISFFMAFGLRGASKPAADAI
ncbi:Major Facilitator Superfamily protein [Abditibacterium utsteinense]|uniref:Major Facilitator Superfamily protein n=1 Tax=Abditibacterium utsteinense TaxID=1960156 RepID=A0A2S8SWU3_9BACT|nr:MFS transporter [Abditibacterium utsteinense]PQV65244.1 Major Facilitator Superfamily protein [Abditibacterium utsteinense]